MNIEIVKKSIRNIPDFPLPGINFKDITTAYQNSDIFNFIINEIFKHYENAGITKVVGIESRGFVLASAIAYRLNVGFIPIRKPGKLPSEKISESYNLEYGFDKLEIHQNSLDKNDVVLIHDDILATGGTIGAAINLVRKFNVLKIHTNFFIELDFLNGKSRIEDSISVFSLIHFNQ